MELTPIWYFGAMVVLRTVLGVAMRPSKKLTFCYWLTNKAGRMPRMLTAYGRTALCSREKRVSAEDC